jgi:hypothetical protein
MGIAEDGPIDARADEEFAEQLKQYAGRWVAVCDRAVVESAYTLDELLECVEGQQQRVEVFQVPEHPDAPCFF